MRETTILMRRGSRPCAWRLTRPGRLSPISGVRLKRGMASPLIRRPRVRRIPPGTPIIRAQRVERQAAPGQGEGRGRHQTPPTPPLCMVSARCSSRGYVDFAREAFVFGDAWRVRKMLLREPRRDPAPRDPREHEPNPMAALATSASATKRSGSKGSDGRATDINSAQAKERRKGIRMLLPKLSSEVLFRSASVAFSRKWE